MVDTRRTNPRNVETSVGLVIRDDNTPAGGGSNTSNVAIDPLPPAPAAPQGENSVLRPEILSPPAPLTPVPLPPTPVTLGTLRGILADVMGSMCEEVTSQTETIMRNVTSMHATQFDGLSKQFTDQIRQLLDQNRRLSVEPITYGLNNSNILYESVPTQGNSLPQWHNVLRTEGLIAFAPLSSLIALNPQISVLTNEDSRLASLVIRPTLFKSQPGLDLLLESANPARLTFPMLEIIHIALISARTTCRSTSTY
ncbi:hypothetical protein Dimus_039449 [Dionaea muscipula]